MSLVFFITLHLYVSVLRTLMPVNLVVLNENVFVNSCK
jgi:hypothetical protein